MHEFAPLIADLHRADLIREAAEERRAALARGATSRTAPWRRAAGRIVDVAGHALEGAARRLDPSIHGAERARFDLAH